MGQIESSKNIQQKGRASFLNELRGTLLEFSCGLGLSKKTIGEKNFLNQCRPSIGLLGQYQDYCRQHDSTAFKFIIEAGDVFTSQVLPHIKEEVEAIELTGKSENKKMFFESDITIKYKSRKELDLISLKLIKKGAFINTKSAGVKSFFEKYFSRQDLQQSFNTKNQLAFNNAVFRFYEMIGEEPSQEETFSAFLQRHRISDRPGNLPSELKEIIFDFYSEVINEMHDLFLILSNDLKSEFLGLLFPLLGLGKSDMLMGIFTHDKDFKKTEFNIFDQRKFVSENVTIHPVSGNTSFIIELDHVYLQIRVKPMNSFTAPSMKVNCSIKFKED